MTVDLISHADALAGKTVLLRANLEQGVTQELGDAVAALAARHARVAVIAGFGEPRGDINPTLSLIRFRQPLEAISRTPVSFITDCVGPVAEAGLERVPFGEAALLENLRFYATGHRDSRGFALRLSVLGDFFAVSGAVPGRPVGWLTELARILPSPDGALTAATGA